MCTPNLVFWANHGAYLNMWGVCEGRGGAHYAEVGTEQMRMLHRCNKLEQEGKDRRIFNCEIYLTLTDRTDECTVLQWKSFESECIMCVNVHHHAKKKKKKKKKKIYCDFLRSGQKQLKVWRPPHLKLMPVFHNNRISYDTWDYIQTFLLWHLHCGSSYGQKPGNASHSDSVSVFFCYLNSSYRAYETYSKQTSEPGASQSSGLLVHRPYFKLPQKTGYLSSFEIL